MPKELPQPEMNRYKGIPIELFATDHVTAVCESIISHDTKNDTCQWSSRISFDCRPSNKTEKYDAMKTNAPCVSGVIFVP